MRHWRPKASALAPQAASLAVVQPGESSCHPSVIPLPQVGFPPVLDDWEADEQLRHIGRALAAEELEAARPEILRIDAAHPGGIARAHRAPERAKSARAVVKKTSEQGLLPFLTWLCTLLGTMTTTCGGMLLGWSAWSARPELWRIGMPIALGGLAVLVVGLLLQLDQSWQQRREVTSLRPKDTSAASS
jgi:hypothetical protein